MQAVEVVVEVDMVELRSVEVVVVDSSWCHSALFCQLPFVLPGFWTLERSIVYRTFYI